MSEQPLSLRKPRFSYYREQVVNVINEYFNQEDPYFPKQVEIIDSIYLTETGKDPSALSKGEQTYARKSRQSSVSKAIEHLVNSGDILEVEPNRYGPNNETVARIKYGNHIVSNVRFNRPDVFVMSSSMIAVDVSEGYKDSAVDSFKKYLGEERCYDVIYFDKYLVVMLLGKTELRKETKKLIQKIVKATYNAQ